MMLRIISITLFAIFLTPPAMAEVDLSKIGGLRQSCKGFLSDDSPLPYVYKGACVGWLVSEAGWRFAACALTTADSPGQFTVSAARDLGRHSFEALAQAFVNWTDKNPESWVLSPTLLATDPTIWAEFPCEAAN